jgi:hypothetical protein
MKQNQKLTKEILTSEPTRISTGQLAMFALLGFGVILTGTHGALFDASHAGVIPQQFRARVMQDLHIHNDFALQHQRVIADPRSLRGVRSDDGKSAQFDAKRGNWDAYLV